MHGELQLIIGRLEDFAAKLHGGLEDADWASKRDLIRALVKRVEVAQNDVNIVFRIDPYPGDNDPEKKSLQLCRGRDGTTLHDAGFGMVQHPCFHDPGTEPFPNEAQYPPVIHSVAERFPQSSPINTIEVSTHIGIHDPAHTLIHAPLA
jgi:hypothetical protein